VIYQAPEGDAPTPTGGFMAKLTANKTVLKTGGIALGAIALGVSIGIAVYHRRHERKLEELAQQQKPKKRKTRRKK